MARERAIDKAKAYREQFREDVRRRAEPEPLAGLRPHRLERYLYLALLPDETPRQQRKAVFDHWERLHSLHGDAFRVALHDQGWRIAVPTGEVFCDFRVVRFPIRQETEEEMLPFVEFGASELRAFASATGRAVGVIENESAFAVDDGRRFALAECGIRPLTDADFVPVKRKRARRKHDS